MDIKEIESNINTRNFSDSNSGGTILHMYTNEKTKLSSVIMCDGPGRSLVPAAARQPLVYAAHAVASKAYTHKAESVCGRTNTHARPRM